MLDSKFEGILKDAKNMTTEEYTELYKELLMEDKPLTQEETEKNFSDSMQNLFSKADLLEFDDDTLGIEDDTIYTEFELNECIKTREEIARNPVSVEDIKSFGDLESIRSFMLGNGYKDITIKITTIFNEDRDISVEVI